MLGASRLLIKINTAPSDFKGQENLTFGYFGQGGVMRVPAVGQPAGRIQQLSDMPSPTPQRLAGTPTLHRGHLPAQGGGL